MNGVRWDVSNLHTADGSNDRLRLVRWLNMSAWHLRSSTERLHCGVLQYRGCHLRHAPGAFQDVDCLVSRDIADMRHSARRIEGHLDVHIRPAAETEVALSF